VSEAEEMKMRLEAMEQKYHELLNELVADTKERNKRFKTIEKDIETLKTTLGSVNKGFWSRSLVTKMIKWGANPENREVAKQLVNMGSEVITGQKLIG
jgi:hypothetical protein